MSPVDNRKPQGEVRWRNGRTPRTVAARIGALICSVFLGALGCGPPLAGDGRLDSGADAAVSDDSAAGDAAEVVTDAAPPRPCPAPARRVSYVLAKIGFVREEPGRVDVADGFNLDNRVSELGDFMTCRQGDMTSTDGEPGIDNQLARLIPQVDMMTGGVLDGAIQTAINNGQMLVVLTLDNVDDLCNDREVNVSVQRVAGMPFVGSDMLPDPGQTFDLMRMSTPTRSTGVISNGVLEITPVDLPLPIAILDAQFTMNFYSAHLRLKIHPDADSQGIIGGGISLAEFRTAVAGFNIPSSLRMTVNNALTLFADLDRDNTNHCLKISGALRVIARPAFVLE
jgi:hypothetical protein